MEKGKRNKMILIPTDTLSCQHMGLVTACRESPRSNERNGMELHDEFVAYGSSDYLIPVFHPIMTDDRGRVVCIDDRHDELEDCVSSECFRTSQKAIFLRPTGRNTKETDFS